MGLVKPDPMVFFAPMPDPLALLLGADGLIGPRSGIGRMTHEIARVLQSHPEVADFALLMRGRIEDRAWLASLDAPAATAPAAAPAAGRLSRAKRLLGDHVPGVTQLHLARRRLALRAQLRAMAGRVRASSTLPMVYHEPNMITRPYDGPVVATLNDLSWYHDPGLHPPERIRWIERNLPRTLAGAARFVAISAFTRDEFATRIGVDPARIDVVHLAPSPEFRPMTAEAAAPALARHELRDGGYVLSISTLEPRKNFDRLLAAYLGLPDAVRQRAPLAIAGGKGWGTVLSRPEAERAVAAGQLRLLGHVPDAELVALTARCAAFAYVSLYEGFGLPVIEAMAAGAPVLASATTATGETAGDAAVLVDPLDVEAIRAGLRRLLDDPDERAAQAAASLRRAAGFTWRRTVDEMARTWRRAATGG